LYKKSASRLFCLIDYLHCE